jgi:predicted nucleic acid-binding protein
VGTVFVLDASVTLTWAFPDETHPMATHAAELLEKGLGQARVPALWWFEVRNILLVSERRGRISAEGTAQFLRSLNWLEIETEQARDQESLFNFARKYRLTVYDAAYLSLAARERIPIATLDRAVQTAATAEGIPLLA